MHVRENRLCYQPGYTVTASLVTVDLLAVHVASRVFTYRSTLRDILENEFELIYI